MPGRTLTSRLYERQLGETEVSYFLPSREDGVNDMYLHLGFRALPHIARRSRVSLVWAILRMRHPLLASGVKMTDYNDVKFVYETPSTKEDALKKANENLEYQFLSKEELLNSYLNGPRTLSSERSSYLILSQPTASPGITPSTTPTGINGHNTHAKHTNGNEANSTRNTLNGDEHAVHKQEYDLLICATHYLGDGMALHQFAHDFFTLLGNHTEGELREILQEEWETRCDVELEPHCALPPALEHRLPASPSGDFSRMAARVDFSANQGKLVGGHSFPRCHGNKRHTIVPTVSFDEERTKKILKSCKAHGVSISSALFAICSISWAKTTDAKWDLPIMMYSALNLRPYLFVERPISDSYWFLSIGYFNVVLPTFLPKLEDGDLHKTFWHRARKAKEQSTNAAKSRMIISRSRLMAEERGARARVWAKEDDDKAAGRRKAPTKAPVPVDPGKVVSKPPSAALMGLSLLGNLDGIYKHDSFPDIQLHTLTTGSRQRAGGLLLFGYTFVGKLWVSLGYDQNGFDRAVIERFWYNVLGSIDELL
ncbi:hypothetical protein E1B28_001462 [Marasmius oreades]|uniref:Alcohol acetyltransferase n=1 Tax=Marasmius oreades TaxID=181124 RepID=A0A9P7V3G1_9AGAR|nr:uncharacterized protein E1B28_001462 [Marasmius oreades]KAG7099636.1 hypothetical protein E1B28_001462 [Marasmius oreades]